MPKRTAKRSTKRSFKRTKRSFKRKPSVPRNKLRLSTGVGFPKTITMTHKYTQLYNTNVPLGAGFTNFYYSCNGMYDPNISGGGHQPLFFDQMTPLYKHYCVIGSKITVSFPITDVDSIVGCFINDDTSIAGGMTLEGLMEQSQTQYRHLLRTATHPTTLSMKWSAKNYFGKNPLANPELQGDVASNPFEQSYFMLFYGPTDKVSIITTFTVNVNIEYIAVWKELNDVQQS